MEPHFFGLESCAAAGMLGAAMEIGKRWRASGGNPDKVGVYADREIVSVYAYVGGEDYIDVIFTADRSGKPVKGVESTGKGPFAIAAAVKRGALGKPPLVDNFHG